MTTESARNCVEEMKALAANTNKRFGVVHFQILNNGARYSIPEDEKHYCSKPTCLVSEIKPIVYIEGQRMDSEINIVEDQTNFKIYLCKKCNDDLLLSADETIIARNDAVVPPVADEL